MSEVAIHTPCEWGDSYWFFEGIEDLAQRRALALINRFGPPGGGVKVCFIHEMIVIAAPLDPFSSSDDIELVARPLTEFVKNYSASNERDADPMALRWIEKIVHWPELGC